MRILIHGINFSPELTGIGKYSGEMALWLVAQGHEVRVVTAPPYYPMWKVASGYANWWGREERQIPPRPPLKKRGEPKAQPPFEIVPSPQPSPLGGEGVDCGGEGVKFVESIVVYRCPLWVPFQPSGLKRLLHLASFALSSFPVMLRQILWRPDVVFVVEPPL